MGLSTDITGVEGSVGFFRVWTNRRKFKHDNPGVEPIVMEEICAPKPKPTSKPAVWLMRVAKQTIDSDIPEPVRQAILLARRQLADKYNIRIDEEPDGQ